MPVSEKVKWIPIFSPNQKAVVTFRIPLASFDPSAPEKWHWRQNCVADEVCLVDAFAPGLYGAATKKKVVYVPFAAPAIGASALALAVYMECGVWQVVH